jgi:AhpD family alkylhydroperoxidase
MIMANTAKEFLEKYKKDSEKVKALMPDVAAGFSGLFSKVMKDGALSLREKELVALGMGIALRCLPCIRLHVKKCFETGSTKEQIMEVAAVAVVMQGGPCFTHISEIIDAIEAYES